MRFDRSTLWALPVLALPLSAGICPPPELAETICTPAQNASVVFYDRTTSAGGDATSAASMDETLHAFVTRGAECAGDVVAGHLIYKHTGAAYGRSVAVEVEVPDLSSIPEVARESAAEQARAELEEEAEDIADVMQQALVGSAAIPAAEANQTDVLGSLRVAGEEFRRAAGGGALAPNRRVLYLSDMFESMPAPGRDFETRPPASDAQAQEWAAEDVARLRTRAASALEALGGARVEVHQSTLAHKEHSDMVRAYWTAVFEALGMTADFT